MFLMSDDAIQAARIFHSSNIGEWMEAVAAETRLNDEATGRSGSEAKAAERQAARTGGVDEDHSRLSPG